MKIVLWLGNESNQRALASKLAEKFQVSGIVTETRKRRLKITGKLLVEKIFEKIFLGKIAAAWKGMKKNYDAVFPDYPAVKSIDVDYINNAEVYDFTLGCSPDLIVVSGTSLIRKKLLSLNPSFGILNLHTGLSPYIKGGPNCTNWCISTKQYHLIGNTVMWIDKGIDTGDIFTTEFVGFDGGESLLQIHKRVMDHAHELCIRSIEALCKGKLSKVKQAEIAEGKTYYTREWGLPEKLNLLRNLNDFRKNIRKGSVASKRSEIRTIKLSDA